MAQNRVRGKRTKVVRVTIEGGAVQHVALPKGVKVIVKDYDTDGVEDRSLKQDENGDKYIETIWE